MDVHILIVDDEVDFRRMVAGYLMQQGYHVSNAGDGNAMREALDRKSFDIVLLDLNLPGENGFNLIPQIRDRSRTGIIMLTGSGDEVNEVVGLELGADDYVAKPCRLRHLEARIRAVLRRTSIEKRSGGEAEPDQLGFAGWCLDLAGRTLTSPSQRDVPLTTAEFACLEALVRNTSRVLRRNQLLQAVYDRDWEPYDRAIDNLVAQLRKKLEADPRKPVLIKSVRGVGYVFSAKVTRISA